MTQPLILSLETATLGGGVFLGRGDVELAAKVGRSDVSHSNSLLSDINDCLTHARVSLDEIDVFACASGPGSFTGLRIGIATVKGLAATLDRPSVGVPTLRAVAHAAGPSSVTVALLPAGRGEVFAQMFSVSADAIMEKDIAAHLSPAKLIERYGGLAQVLWAGNGAHNERNFLAEQAEQRGLQFDELKSDAADGWRLAPKVENLARNVAALALRDYNAGAVQSAQSLSAIYVRPSDPELKEQCR
ncbi:MAG TPA: tRNA (adenosine(37)-N6)-threonylcarbamoyltransferase complex dimerization subunit type 1 TsaB [Pyrinomonadaceae bacterium]|nr:tRNA (adenosine(37)-N6)-threonylcarbamoyltransferase complex dimerization subunit type 1 TsaB [Pyrinomonadaceae bacterium]